MIDHESAWTELQAWIAEEPNRGRVATLQKMAELAAKHQVPEDELERALRLVGPRIQDVLFNRIGHVMDLVAEHSQETNQPEVGEGSAERRPETVRHSMAAT